MKTGAGENRAIVRNATPAVVFQILHPVDLFLIDTIGIKDEAARIRQGEHRRTQRRRLLRGMQRNKRR